MGCGASAEVKHSEKDHKKDKSHGDHDKKKDKEKHDDQGKEKDHGSDHKKKDGEHSKHHDKEKEKDHDDHKHKDEIDGKHHDKHDSGKKHKKDKKHKNEHDSSDESDDGKKHKNPKENVAKPCATVPPIVMDAPKAPVQAEIQRPPSPKKEAPPAQEAPQIAPTQKTPPSVEKVAEQKDLLQQYIAIENEIREIQGKVNPNYKTLLSVAKESAERVKDLEKDYKKAQKRTKEEAEDVEKFYEKWGRHDGDNTALEKEKQEWLEAVGKEEALSKELEAMRALNDANQRALKQEKDDYELMQKKLQQQEDLIFKIFKGSYGSEAENKLEAEYDFLVEKEQRIAAAKYKWVNGRNLLQYATAQLSVACKKWASISTIPITNQPLRLMVVTESRNNSIAAAQNITAANQYLSTVQFPYCKPEEVKVLQTAAANVYIDSLTIERQQYVYANVYLSMFKRCKALVDWFSYVIEETIDKDLKQANKEVKEASFKLKQERCRCIAELVKTELNIDFVHQVKEEPVAPEVLVPVVDQSSQVVAPVPNSSEKSNEEDPPESEVAADQPFNPVPLKDLVQAPRKEELFGDVQELLKKHQEEIQELEKDNMVNRARQEQDLQEKLQARRNRRQRQAALGVEATPAGTPVHTAAA